MRLSWFLVMAVIGCTKPNPAVCCLDEADCKANGFQGLQSCAIGLACVDHECVLPSCSMTGCVAAMPVCNITTDVCEACTDSSACSHFTDTPICDTTTGGCVQCVGPSDCSGATPVCDASACRGCKADSECPSGACGDDGTCVPESSAVYLDPGGTDAGTCTRSAPCRKVMFGVSQTSPTRNHIVMAAGGYTEIVNITPQSTAASRLYIHGGGAGMSLPPGTVEGTVLTLSLPATIRDLEVQGQQGGGSISLQANSYLLERLKIVGGYVGIGVVSAATIRDVYIEGSSDAILTNAGAQLDIDRVTIAGGARGITAQSSTVQISNTLVYGTTAGLAIDLTSSNGTLSFVTVADSGTDSGNGPRAVACGTLITLRSSIIWAPGTVSRPPVEGCNLVSTIAGPTAVPGAMNINPSFVNSAAHDYHLAANSPARDAVDTGPATDFERDPRPQGARFDIGADEAP